MTDTATDLEDSPIRRFAQNAWLYVLGLGIAAIATGAVVGENAFVERDSFSIRTG